MIPLTRGMKSSEYSQPYSCKYQYSQRDRFHKTYKNMSIKKVVTLLKNPRGWEAFCTLNYPLFAYNKP